MRSLKTPLIIGSMIYLLLLVPLGIAYAQTPSDAIMMKP
jgi:hypothetical protein